MIDYNLKVNDLEILPFQGKVDPELIKNSEISEDEIRKYFGFLKASDDALKIFMRKMREKGLLKNTVIFIYSDHRYYNFVQEDAWEK